MNKLTAILLIVFFFVSCKSGGERVSEEKKDSTAIGGLGIIDSSYNTHMTFPCDSIIVVRHWGGWTFTEKMKLYCDTLDYRVKYDSLIKVLGKCNNKVKDGSIGPNALYQRTTGRPNTGMTKDYLVPYDAKSTTGGFNTPIGPDVQLHAIVKYYSVSLRNYNSWADRDTLGHWEIHGSCDSLLEAMYKAYLDKK